MPANKKIAHIYPVAGDGKEHILRIAHTCVWLSLSALWSLATQSLSFSSKSQIIIFFSLTLIHSLWSVALNLTNRMSLCLLVSKCLALFLFTPSWGFLLLPTSSSRSPSLVLPLWLSWHLSNYPFLVFFRKTPYCLPITFRHFVFQSKPSFHFVLSCLTAPIHSHYISYHQCTNDSRVSFCVCVYVYRVSIL